MNIDDIKEEMDPPLMWGDEEAIDEFVGRIKRHGFRIVKIIDEGRDVDEYGGAYGPDQFSIVEEL